MEITKPTKKTVLYRGQKEKTLLEAVAEKQESVLDKVLEVHGQEAKPQPKPLVKFAAVARQFPAVPKAKPKSAPKPVAKPKTGGCGGW